MRTLNQTVNLARRTEEPDFPGGLMPDGGAAGAANGAGGNGGGPVVVIWEHIK